MFWRYLLAMVLTMAVILAWQALQPPPARKPPAEPGVPPAEAPQVSREKAPRGVEEAAGAEAAPQVSRVSRPRETARASVPGVCEYAADSRGACLTDLWLLGYWESVGDRRPYRLFSAVEEGFGVLGLAVESDAGAGSRIPPEENWSIRTASNESGVVRVEFQNEVDGIRILKSVEPGSMEDLGGAGGEGNARARHLKVRLSFSNASGEPRPLSYRLYGIAGVDSENTTVQAEGSDLYVVIGAFSGSAVQCAALSPSKLPGGKWERNHTVAWVGVTNNYFASVLFPLPVGPRQGFVDRAFAEAYPDEEALRNAARKEMGRELRELDASSRKSLEQKVFKNVRCGLRTARFTLAPGETAVHEYGLYVGSRESSQLAPYEKLGLEGINQYGMFGFLVRLFMGTLKVLRSVALGSWGVAIILLTLFVKVCLHPINRRSQASMQRFQKQMQQIKPEMDELKARYGDNRTKLNAEMQKLWKKHGINPAQPMAGCLVLFLQLPIWWGLYSTLQYSIGLRQAGFLWIRDLTRPDELLRLGLKGLPLFGDKLEYLNALPILYVLLTILQQRAQPRPEDPQMLAQYRTMTFMMVVFGFIFYNFPAGFMLYIMTSAALGILESRIIKAALAKEDRAKLGAPSPQGKPLPLWKKSRSKGTSAPGSPKKGLR